MALTERHGGTFQNVLRQRTADGFVEIGFDKRGWICFHKFTCDFPCMDRVRNIFFFTANRYTFFGGTTVVLVVVMVSTCAVYYYIMVVLLPAPNYKLTRPVDILYSRFYCFKLALHGGTSEKVRPSKKSTNWVCTTQKAGRVRRNFNSIVVHDLNAQICLSFTLVMIAIENFHNHLKARITSAAIAVVF